jgi:hypothetical protein
MDDQRTNDPKLRSGTNAVRQSASIRIARNKRTGAGLFVESNDCTRTADNQCTVNGNDGDGT